MRADALPPEVERELAAIDEALAGGPVDPDLTDLARLATDLRAERPLPPPKFTDDLDRRVAAGFPREPGRLARWRAKRPGLMPGLAFAACLLIALAVAVPLIRDRSGDAPTGAGTPDDAGLAASSAGDEPAARESAGASEAAAPESADATGAISPPALPSTGGGAADDRPARKVERSASMTLGVEPEGFDRVADEIVRTADALGGFVVSSSVSSGAGGDGSGSFELRVPSERLGQALARLSRLAHVRERQQATLDITAGAVSARERLTEARAERRSLLRRLERADSDEETEALRRRLRLATARIRAARADVARLDNRAAFSTIVVALVTDPASAGGADRDDGVWSPGDAARDAVRVLEVAVGIALVALAVLLPLALLAALGLAAGRRVGQRRRERALDAG